MRGETAVPNAREASKAFPSAGEGVLYARGVCYGTTRSEGSSGNCFGKLVVMRRMRRRLERERRKDDEERAALKGEGGQRNMTVATWNVRTRVEKGKRRWAR